MRREKVVFMIPGFGESHLKQRGYNKVAKIFQNQNITPVHIEIGWFKTKPYKFSNYIEQFLRQYKKPKNADVYILGFSYGAMIAFLTANKLKPKTLILCSLSPYFVEDLKTFKPSWLKWWKENFVDSDFHFDKLVSKVSAQTYLVVGDKEPEVCMVRAKDAKKKLNKASLYVAKGAKHNLGQKEYVVELEKVINRL
jgi:pimeloyl-ACP methyl ester carboxylesterase